MQDKDLEELRREIILEVLYSILDRFDFPECGDPRQPFRQVRGGWSRRRYRT